MTSDLKGKMHTQAVEPSLQSGAGLLQLSELRRFLINEKEVKRRRRHAVSEHIIDPKLSLD